MTTTLVRSEQDQEQFSIIEQVVITGDLAKLSSQQRVAYYNRVCESVGLNPFTSPFSYINLNGKLKLYVNKDATEQLRRLHGISITSLAGRVVDDLYIVTVTAQSRDGRIDQATGAVSIGGKKGEDKANAIMKAETKGKRRVTLSMAGLGWLDESEVDSIPGAQRVYVDTGTGEIIESSPKPAHRQIQQQSDPLAEVNFGMGESTAEEQPVQTNGHAPKAGQITDAQRGTLHALGAVLYNGDWDAKRHELVKAATKKRASSSNDLTQAEAQTLTVGLERKTRQAYEKLANELTSGAVIDPGLLVEIDVLHGVELANAYREMRRMSEAQGESVAA